ncbi:MAG: SDR family NAD(P)-dependent oxidoreductase [Chloroflexi bacterium]|nr:SDR family NAD(P)-dependent oxidoreductase [Chloroflexota bacterium]
MQEFKDKVAVITGAGSGIGRALAARCAHEGMRVVAADVNEHDLNGTVQALRDAGGDAVAVRTDVSKLADVEALAQQTLDAYGAAHVLMNVAGVLGMGTTIWETPLADWEWVLGVNLWGTIHTIRVFVPLMLAQDTECYIVNTASMVGLVSDNPFAPYQVSKYAVVGLAENLYHSLARQDGKIRTSVLCPGLVNTQIMDAERYARAEQQDAPLEREAIMRNMRQAAASGMSPEEVAELVFRAIRREQFYILTHADSAARVQRRMENIIHGRNP